MTDKHFTPTPASFCLLDERQCCPRRQCLPRTRRQCCPQASACLTKRELRIFLLNVYFLLCLFKAREQVVCQRRRGEIQLHTRESPAQTAGTGSGRNMGDLGWRWGGAHKNRQTQKKPLNTAQSAGHDYSRYLSQLLSRHRPPRHSPRASSCQPEAEYSGPSQPSRQPLRQPCRRSTP